LKIENGISFRKKGGNGMKLTQLTHEFLFDCEARDLSDKTVINYRRQCEYLLNYLMETHSIDTLEAVEPKHIKEFLVIMAQKGRKPAYLNDLLKAYKCLFRYALDEGYTDTLITAKVKNVKEPKVLIHSFSPIEVKKMCSYYVGHDYLSIRNRVIIMMLFDTGIRVNELVSMKISQLNEGYIIIYGKGSKERIVPKSPLLGKWLFKYLAVRESYCLYRGVPDNVFLSKNGKVLTPEAVSKLMKTAGKAVDVDKSIRVSPHTCRHTFAHLQLKNGLDVYSLSRLLGHESISITQRYLDGIRNDEVLLSAQNTGVLANL